MKTLFAFILCLLSLSASAISPSYESFDTNIFSTNSLRIGLKAALSNAFVLRTNGVSYTQTLFKAKSLSSFSSNETLVRAYFYPSNIYTGQGTISGTIGSHIFTTTNAGFSALVLGDNIVIGSDQYVITSRDSTTQIRTFEPLSSTYASVAWIVYPNAAVYYDINGVVAGGVQNDGSTFNNGGFSLGYTMFGPNGSNSWRWQVYPLGNLRLFNYTAASGPTPDVFDIDSQNANNYEAAHLMFNGLLSLRYGLTNTFGHLTNATDVDFLQTQTQREPRNWFVAPTASGSISTHVLTFASAHGAKVGDVIEFPLTSESYVVSLVPGSTTVNTVEALLRNYSSVTNNVRVAMNYRLDSGGSYDAFTTRDGELGLGERKRIIWTDRLTGSNNWTAGTDDNGDWNLYNRATPATGNPITVSATAGYESLRIMGNGVVSLRFGLTNVDTGFLTNKALTVFEKPIHVANTNATPSSATTIAWYYITNKADGKAYAIPLAAVP